MFKEGRDVYLTPKEMDFIFKFYKCAGYLSSLDRHNTIYVGETKVILDDAKVTTNAGLLNLKRHQENQGGVTID